ncbi:MAG: ATP-binding protein [Anaerolineae bacterium]|nr:ATP-binding protein [Anaerolineae bacterium]NUQ02894.1 HAMP domain-containing protein [Anaerolineae bacterium]
MDESLETLLTLLTAIALFSMGSAYAIYRARLLRRLPSLRWALFVMVILIVALLFANVWVSAQLMFISPYDLNLTGVLLVFAALVAIGFGFFVSRAITEAISELGGAAERIAQGRLDTRLPVEGRDELAQFARTFNAMARSLQELDAQKRQLDQQRRDLIAWASHDLRTPVTSIRAMIEALADGVVSDPASTARYARDMQSEIENLTRLIDNLLELAQLDAGHIHLDKQPTSLRDMVSDTLSGMSARAALAGIALSGAVDDSVDLISAAPDKIQRVLNNLLDNALRYTPRGGTVRIIVERDRDMAHIVVNNHAEGMEMLDVTSAFTRFYRRESSRARSDDGRRGAGLGLAIARGFVEAHGGIIEAQSSPGQGVTITVRLPIEPRERERAAS